MTQEKTVGILGGMGPYATVDFYRQVLQCTPAKKDWEHVRILIDSNVKIPSRTRSILYGEASPAPQMIESIEGLAKVGADFVVVPCNSAHFFYPEVSQNTSIPWLNIVEVVAEHLRSLQKKRPLILGGYVTTEKKIYSALIPEAVYLDDEGNRQIEKMIDEIKVTSALSLQSREVLESLIEGQSSVCDAVILACTELPIVISESSIHGLDVIDANQLYAQKTVDFAKGT